MASFPQRVVRHHGNWFASIHHCSVETKRRRRFPIASRSSLCPMVETTMDEFKPMVETTMDDDCKFLLCNGNHRFFEHGHKMQQKILLCSGLEVAACVKNEG